MTIDLGAWAIPLAVTIAAFAWMAWPRSYPDQGGMFGGVGEAIALTYRLALFTIITLSAWLVWALWT